MPISRSQNGTYLIWVNFMFRYNNELNEIQQQYLALLQEFESLTGSEDYFYEVANFVDKCEFLWMSKRIEIISVLNDISSEEYCLILSGAVYVNTVDNGHYAMGAIGDRIIINDPVMKMRSVLLNSNGCSLSPGILKCFVDAIHDTVVLLNDYSHCFVVLPLDYYLSKESDEKIKLAEKAYWKVLSYVLNQSICSAGDLKKKYHSLNELETAMGDASSSFIFSGVEDVQVSLSERLNAWTEYSSMAIAPIQNEMDRFFLASMSCFQNAFGILYDSVSFGLHPFVRNDVATHYLFMIADIFQDDNIIHACMECALISYLLNNFVVTEDDYKVEFNDFRKKFREVNLYDLFRDAVFNTSRSFAVINIDDAVSKMRKILDNTLKE